jgi:hypothetical protein
MILALISTAGRLMLMPYLILEHFDTVERIERLLANNEDGRREQTLPLPFKVPNSR